jgi:hypothetical protein
MKILSPEEYIHKEYEIKHLFDIMEMQDLKSLLLLFDEYAQYVKQQTNKEVIEEIEERIEKLKKDEFYIDAIFEQTIAEDIQFLQTILKKLK